MDNQNLKEFKPTSWSINNRTAIYITTVIITFFGLFTYVNLPKENFPEVVFPNIVISTMKSGTSPSDMQDLITQPIEKQLKSVTGVKRITSTSRQDFSLISVEFNVDENIPEAKQRVKDAVDKAKRELPKDLLDDPSVQEIDISEFPIMNINISGDYDLDKLKNYAEMLEDEIEGFKEIRRVDIIGALDREIQVNVDMYKMASRQISFSDIVGAIGSENLTYPGGNVEMDGMKRSVRVVGKFQSSEDLNNIIIRPMNGANVYLKDIADINDSHKERESYSRMDHKNVLTLNVIKKGGANLVEASKKIEERIRELQKERLPEGLKIKITGQQSEQTENTLNDLINTIIIGFVLVTLILMFFMGATNAIFVGLSVPLSTFLAFMIMPSIDFSLNMITLFALLFALGIVVDDAIVVIENTHRIYANGKVPIVKAAKQAAGEVFVPVLAGTLTTLAPFVPLAFWDSVIGKFMFYLPITLILVLIASLVVAFVINPVFAVSFMKPEDHEGDKRKSILQKLREQKLASILFLSFAGIFYLSGATGIGNLLVFLLMIIVVYNLYIVKIVNKFQFVLIPKFKNAYARLISWILVGSRSGLLIAGTVVFFFTLFITATFPPKVSFFPVGQPNFLMVYIKTPTGTDLRTTDSITQIAESRVYKVIGENNPIVRAVIANVGVGASEDQMMGGFGSDPTTGKITVAFVPIGERNGISTADYLGKVRKEVQDIVGAEITVDQEQAGPPVGKPVNIEIIGEDYEALIKESKRIKNYLDSLEIPGIEELKSDADVTKPEVVITIDRERAQREGISTAVIGDAINTALYGREASKLKINEDEYPIQVRHTLSQRKDIEQLLNTPVTYMDMAMGGMIRQVPLSSVAKAEYVTSYGSIKRKNHEKVITLSSNVLTGFTPDEVNRSIQKELGYLDKTDGIKIDMTGQQEEQNEAAAFLMKALLQALALILIILVAQFNSLVKPLIILSEIIFSIIGILLGFVLFRMEISVVMTGVGIVGLAGIVVKNGILIIEFIDTGRAKGMRTRKAIIEAGRTRLSPVLLTATATILGLIPLAVGLNINFFTLFSDFEPHFYLGGESVVFWGPLAWTIIFGLSFATFLTLILVPAMFYFLYVRRAKMKRMWYRWNYGRENFNYLNEKERLRRLAETV
jgi:multidrug efflux pump subunit AcrB